MDAGYGLILGLEEFNFTQPYLDLKVAFVPCYRSHTYNDVVDLCLFHRYNGAEAFNGIHNFVHAKLRNVRQVQPHQVDELRKLITARLPEVLGQGNTWANGMAAGGSAPFLREAYMRALAMNNITRAGHDGSFVVNVIYDEIEFCFDRNKPCHDPIGIPTNYGGRMANVRGRMECP